MSDARKAPDLYVLNIRGMHCTGCSGSVERALRGVAGVAAAHVSLATERATVWPAGSSEIPVDVLVQAVRAAGYEATPASSRSAADDEAARIADLAGQRRRLIAAVALGAPVMLWHLAAVAGWAGTHAGMIAAGLVEAALALAVVLVGAGPMIVGAARALRSGAGSMDLLVTLGVFASLASGIGGLLLGLHGHGMFDAAVMIVIFVGAGKYLEARARGRASQALRTLLGRIPALAVRVVDGRAEQVPVAQLRLHDRVRVPPDATIPVDGIVVEGHAAIDESLLTGESVPVERGPGAAVWGGTRVAEGVVDIDATSTGHDNAAARIAALVEHAQTTKPPWQRFGDRAAAVFVPVVLVLAAGTFLGWWLLGGASVAAALERMIAVLVVACPCAMGLAIPTAVMVGTARAAELGILVREASTLEAAGAVREVLLDKTGTLTLGRPRVERIVVIPGAAVVAGQGRMEVGGDSGLYPPVVPPKRGDGSEERSPATSGPATSGPAASSPEGIGPAAGGLRAAPLPLREGAGGGSNPANLGTPALDEDLILALAASVEQHSEHPLARAVVAAAEARGLPRYHPSNLRSRHGGGVAAAVTVDEHAYSVIVGSADWLRERAVDVAHVLEQIDALAAQGFSVVCVAIDRRVAALLALSDAPHPDAAAAVRDLESLGVGVRILSGDRHAAVSQLAGVLGIGLFEAQLKPADKLARVQALAAQGRRVAMVGDGLNDAPALAAADVGIAIGTGADVAREAADICLVGHSPRLIAQAIRISRASARIMKQNLGWAVGYNVVMLPLAIFSPLPPALATAAMMCSSLSVVANSLRLRRAERGASDSIH